MAYFKPVRNVPAVVEFPCATTAVITRGAPIILSSGLATNANDTTFADIIGVSAEGVSSPADGRVGVFPAASGAMFSFYSTSHDATSIGVAYKTTCATNAVTLQTTAQVTTASGFRVIDYDTNTSHAIVTIVNSGFNSDL